MGFEPWTSRSGVRRSSTEPPLLQDLLKYWLHYKVQANFDMSNLLISKTPLVLKWSSIPEFSPYIFLYFDLVCVELAYDENSAV